MNKTLKSRVVLASAAMLVCAAANSRGQNSDRRNIELGFEQRVRNENWNNLFDWSSAADDQRAQIRYRTRLWTSVPVTSKITVNAGLAQETNQIVVARQPWKFDEVVLETANVEFRDLFTRGLSLKVGRQNIIKGEGFLFMEGNPWDGSRSIYFNAANLGYAFGRSKIEAVAISNPSRDRYLPRINDQHRLLVEWDEQALGSYFTHNRKNTDVEAYYFLKKEIRDTRPASNPQFQPDRHVSTAGARAIHRWGRGWSLTGEWAQQWGADHARRDIRAWGGYGYVKKQFASRMKPYLQSGYWVMSGSDPQDPRRVGGFDPLFSRWPKWSEMYLYSLFRETGVGYWTNLAMFQAEAMFTPWKPVNWRFSFYHMDSFHRFAGSPQIFDNGTRRGEMFQSRMDFTINPSWRGHVLYEHMLPGSFYRQRDAAYFLRFELSYSFKHQFAL